MYVYVCVYVCVCVCLCVSVCDRRVDTSVLVCEIQERKSHLEGHSPGSECVSEGGVCVCV